MKIRELRTSVRNFRAGIPGLVSLMVFDREKNLLLYGESDDLMSSLGGISSCYASWPTDWKRPTPPGKPAWESQ